MKEISSFPPPVFPDLNIPLTVQRQASLKRFEIALENIYAKYGQDFGDTEEVDLLTGEVFVQGESQWGKLYPTIIPFGSLTSYMDKTEKKAPSKKVTYSIDELDEFILDSLAPALTPHTTSTKEKPPDTSFLYSSPVVPLKSSHPIPFPLEAVPLDEFAMSETPSTFTQKSSPFTIQSKEYSSEDLDEFIINSSNFIDNSNKTKLKSASSHPHSSIPKSNISTSSTSSISLPSKSSFKLSSSHIRTSNVSFHVEKKKPILKKKPLSNVRLKKPPSKLVNTRTSPIFTRFRSLLTPSSSSSSIVSESSIQPRPPDRPLERKKTTNVVIEISPIKSTPLLKKLSLHSTSPPSSPTPKRRKVSFSSPFVSFPLTQSKSLTTFNSSFGLSHTPSAFPLKRSLYPNAQPIVPKFMDPPSSPVSDELAVTSSSPVFLSRRKSAYPELIDFSLDYLKDELAI